MIAIEERYIVIKRKHLSYSEETRLREFLADNFIDTVECVVIESKWQPEYDAAWDLICQKVERESND